MAVLIPDLSLAQFRDALLETLPEAPPEPVVESLFRFYVELRRWGRRQALIGSGTVDEVVARHFAESLAVRPLLPRRSGRLVDLGSGAGFPGAVIAALRPDLDVWLVESRFRKVAFLRHATEKASLVCHCLNARVGAALPDGFPDNVDVLTLRAVRLGPEIWGRLREVLSPAGRVLVWGGPEPPKELGDWKLGRRVRLPGERRWILELTPAER